MKKNLLVFFACAFSIALSAFPLASEQFPKANRQNSDSGRINKWGKAFHTVAIESGVAFSGRAGFDYFPVTGLNICVGYSYHFRNVPLAIQTELDYEMEWVGNIRTGKYATKRNYIQIPLLFKLDFTDRKITGGFYLGPSLNILLGNYYQARSYSSAYITDKKTGMNMIIGANLKVPISKGFGFLFDTRFNVSCTPMIANEETHHTRNYSYYIYVNHLYINAGVYYKWSGYRH